MIKNVVVRFWLHKEVGIDSYGTDMVIQEFAVFSHVNQHELNRLRH